MQKSALFKNIAKALSNNKEEILRVGLGGATGLATSKYALDPMAIPEGIHGEKGLAGLNDVANTILGGFLGSKASAGHRWKTLGYGIGGKELAIGGAMNLNKNLQDTTKSISDLQKDIKPVTENLRAGSEDFAKGMQTQSEMLGKMSPFQKGALGLGAVGLGGAGLYGLYNAMKDKEKANDRGKQDVAINIPGSKISDKFYNELSREMLFYSPEGKKQRIAELLAEPNKKHRKPPFVNKHPAGEVYQLEPVFTEKSAKAIMPTVQSMQNTGRAAMNANTEEGSGFGNTLLNGISMLTPIVSSFFPGAQLAGALPKTTGMRTPRYFNQSLSPAMQEYQNITASQSPMNGYSEFAGQQHGTNPINFNYAPHQPDLVETGLGLYKGLTGQTNGPMYQA